MSGLQITNNNVAHEYDVINIRDTIESMNKFNQVEILRIFVKHSITLNENRYGVHINLSDICEEILEEIVFFINYVNTQETVLDNVEQQKESFKNIFFSKDIKDNKEK
jgi:hypothetical protein